MLRQHSLDATTARRSVQAAAALASGRGLALPPPAVHARRRMRLTSSCGRRSSSGESSTSVSPASVSSCEAQTIMADIDLLLSLFLARE